MLLFVKKNPVIRLLLSLLLFLLSCSSILAAEAASDEETAKTTTSTTTTTSTHQDEVVQEMINWMKEKGGYIHPSVQIRRWNVSDPTSYYGIFVERNNNDEGVVISEDELIMTVPASIRLQVSEEYMTGDKPYVETLCELAWTLKREYDLEDKSSYEPYIEYLKLQPKNQLPVMWSDTGKELLTKVQGSLGMTDFFREPVNGEHMVDWIDDWFSGADCMIDEGEELEEFYIALVTQRGFDYSLVPVYDMLNHHNGNVNTESRPSIFDPDGFSVYALRDLEQGEELFFSYHDCPDCYDTCDKDDDDDGDDDDSDDDSYDDSDECSVSTMDYWGTPEMLRDFGFVEPYPHRFHLVQEDGEQFTLLIDKSTAATEESSDDQGKEEDEDEKDVTSYDIGCVNLCPSFECAQDHVSRLQELYETDILPAKDLLPPHEYRTIAAYHTAIYTAFATFLDTFDEDDFEEDDDSDDTANRNENVAEF
eukprot:scaffold1389_cov122-Cylindrotheca_fusiformis.AAC.2